jgi:hypothetical protein
MLPCPIMKKVVKGLSPDKRVKLEERIEMSDKSVNLESLDLEALYHRYLVELGEADGHSDTVGLEEDAPQGVTYEDYLRALGLGDEAARPVNLSEGGDEYQSFVDELGAGAVARRARQYAERLQRDRDEIAEANEKHREEMMMRGGWEERLRRIRLGWHKGRK